MNCVVCSIMWWRPLFIEKMCAILRLFQTALLSAVQILAIKGKFSSKEVKMGWGVNFNHKIKACAAVFG